MSAPTVAKQTPVKTLPLEKRIRRCAYELYLQRGNQPGYDIEEWLQAEEKTRDRHASHPATLAANGRWPAFADRLLLATWSLTEAQTRPGGQGKTGDCAA